MSLTRRIAILSASVLLALPISGCETTETADATSSDGMMPVNERDAQRKAEWAEAIKGLQFDTGLVVVTTPPARSDLALAKDKIQQGHLELQVNHKTQAVKLFADAVRAAPELPAAYFDLGRALRVKGKDDMSIAAFRTFTTKAPDDKVGHYELAMALSMVTRQQEAIVAMNQALDIDPGYGDAHERLAIWHYYAEDNAKAWHHVQEARRVDHTMPPQFIALLNKTMPEPLTR